jgi:hypothetical protein
MFECGGVINRLGPIAVKNFHHQRRVQNIPENGGVRGFSGSRKLQIDFVEILLGMARSIRKRGLLKARACTSAEPMRPPAPVPRTVLPVLVVPSKGAFASEFSLLRNCRCAQLRTQELKVNAAGSQWPERRDHPRQPIG